MSLYAKIKSIYPDILDNEFILQDDSNGLGAYIKTWLSAHPQPTPAQIAAIDDATANNTLAAQRLAETKTFLKNYVQNDPVQKTILTVLVQLKATADGTTTTVARNAILNILDGNIT